MKKYQIIWFFSKSCIYLLIQQDTTMKEKEKQQVLITQKGKSVKDYLVLKEQEYYREKSLERQINKYYRIKE